MTALIVSLTGQCRQSVWGEKEKMPRSVGPLGDLELVWCFSHYLGLLTKV